MEASPKNIQRVASVVGDEAARWAFSQWELRRRARAKFELAHQMLFDRDGLEMASHERVAAYHASRFQAGERVADLTCGIGGDLIALARRGPVVGFEIDPVRAAYARHNLAVHGLEGEVREEKAPMEPDADSVFLDPQRRGKDDAFGEPDPRGLDSAGYRVVGVKLGTGLSLTEAAVFPRVEAVSFGGECRELLSWTGEEGVFAVHVESGEVLESIDAPLPVSEPGAFLFHADPAAIKARCLGRFGLAPLGDSDGYLTGDQLVESPWLRGYRVHWHGSGDRKRTQKAIDDLGGFVAEVKTRGVREPADRLRAQFRRSGDRPLTLVVWTEGKSLRFALVRSITQEL
jgi:hypothetical protein